MATKELPTDESGQTILPITKPDGSPMPTDASGNFVTDDGAVIEKNEDGQPIGPDGEVLPTDDSGNYIYPVIGPDGSPLPTDANNKPVYPVVGPDGTPLPTDDSGAVVGPDGEPLPTDASGKPVGADGQVLPTDQNGNYVVLPSDEMDMKDVSPHEVSRDGRPTEVYPVIGPDGSPHPTNDEGLYLTLDGDEIARNDNGQPIGPDGKTLPTDGTGSYIYPVLSADGIPLATDTSGKPIYPVVGPDGLPHPTNDDGMYLTLKGEEIPRNENGRPLGPDSFVLPTDNSGNYIYPILSEDGFPIPTDATGKPIYPVVSPDGTVHPTNDQGLFLTFGGDEISRDDVGMPLGPDGTMLPKNADGNYIYPIISVDGQPLPTDVNGLTIYPVVDHTGTLHPTDDTGNYLSLKGDPIAKNAKGLPLGPDGGVLPKHANGNYVYPATAADGSVLPTDSIGNPIFPVVSPDGTLHPTDDTGRFLTLAGEPISLDENAYPLGPDNERLPTDVAGNFIYPVIGEDGLPLPTDSNHRPVYPVVGMDRELRPTDEQGLVVDHSGSPIPTDSAGRPLTTFGGARLPTDSSGRYSLRPTSAHCVVGANIDLLVVLDTSKEVKILDYRVMKELIKTFLHDHFDMTRDRVRMGVVKYGDSAEVPVSLGDYDNEDELLTHLGEARRLKGLPHLGAALREAAGEFLLSAADDHAPRVVIVFKNGPTVDDVTEPMATLRDELQASVFVADAGGDESWSETIKMVPADRAIQVPSWRGQDAEILGPIADMICKLHPRGESTSTWPAKKTTRPATASRACQRIDYEADVIVMLDSSENFSPDEFNELKEGVATLVDESFDLAPDVARIGFVIYSDKVAVPVALGHYEDKIELLELITDAEKINDGVAISLYALSAARQQFQLHGRANATRIVVLVTNGQNRGNAAVAAEELRDQHDVQLFVVAVAAKPDDLASLKRVAGDDMDRVIEVESVDTLDDKLREVSSRLCGHTTPAHLPTPTEAAFRITTKRDVEAVQRITTPSGMRTTRTLEMPPLCSDGIRRPFELTILIDTTARSSAEEFGQVLGALRQFLLDRFGYSHNMLTLNMLAVDSEKVRVSQENVQINDVPDVLATIQQNSEDTLAAKLGLGIDEAVQLANKNHVKGVHRMLLVLSADGTSSDEALPAAEYATGDFGINIIGLSIRKPSTDMLATMAGGVATNVIHFADWSASDELFSSWMSYAMCEYVKATTTRKPTTPRMRLTTPKPTSRVNPANVEVTATSPTSFSVSWTCCTNNKANYSVLYTPDPAVPKEYWQRRDHSCRDSFGTPINGVPSDTTYTVCVVNSKLSLDELNVESNCATVSLDKNTTPPPDFVPMEMSPCNCRCVEGRALLQPSCDGALDPFRPISTLPPATEGECPCKMEASGGRCPAGYMLAKAQCYDVDECRVENGKCSHGCVNTPGSYYCACPHGMMRDPMEPTQCIDQANSFERIAQLISQYLHANTAKTGAIDATADENGHKYKATIRSGDSKTITFEWTSVPAAVRRALRWLL